MFAVKQSSCHREVAPVSPVVVDSSTEGCQFYMANVFHLPPLLAWMCLRVVFHRAIVALGLVHS